MINSDYKYTLLSPIPEDEHEDEDEDEDEDEELDIISYSIKIFGPCIKVCYPIFSYLE